MYKIPILIIILFSSCSSFFIKPNSWFVPFSKEEIKISKTEFNLEENYVYDVYIEKGKPARIISDNGLCAFNEKNGRLFKEEEDAKKYSLYRSMEKTKKKLEELSDEDKKYYKNNLLGSAAFKKYSFAPKLNFSLPSTFSAPLEKIISENKIDQTIIDIKSINYFSDKASIVLYDINDYREMIKKSALENDKKNFDTLLKIIKKDEKIKKENIIEPSFTPKRFFSYIYGIKKSNYIGYWYIYQTVLFDEKANADFMIKYLLISENNSLIISASVNIESIFLNKLYYEIKNGSIKINSENEIPAFTEKLLSEKSILSNSKELSDRIVESISF